MKDIPAVFCTALIVMTLSAGVDAGLLSIAHRGNSRFAPENTLSAFSSAGGKADMVEFDVRTSADGHLVVMHDGTVNRTTDVDVHRTCLDRVL